MDIKSYLEDIRNITLNIDLLVLENIINILDQARENNRAIYVFGNGGSSTTASHIAGDLKKTAGLNATCLTDSAYLVTALANDFEYKDIFVQQLTNLSRYDVVIAISGSGKSRNIIQALEYAKGEGAIRIGLTGFDGGLVKTLVNECLIVPSDCMEQIEDIHLMIGHILTVCLK